MKKRSTSEQTLAAHIDMIRCAHRSVALATAKRVLQKECPELGPKAIGWIAWLVAETDALRNVVITSLLREMARGEEQKTKTLAKRAKRGAK